MKEILFKAKRIDDGEWVVGSYALHPKGNCSISVILDKCQNPPDCDPMWQKVLISHEVDRKTVCQYTGFTDKNGNKVWENDVIECEDGKRHFKSQVEWDEKAGCFILQDSHTSFVGLDAIGEGGCYRDCIVVCNIFDNPDLIGEQNG